ncbi:MAG: glucose-6-phosphate isomerase [Oscillospiraceae bacterium]|nr:glucose-6-phosphate isomerase [Oscillospiraceae bacterium]
MLELSLVDQRGTVSEGELADYIGDHAHVLDQIQSGEERYADSLGWLDVSQWANSEALDKLQQKADEVRESADVFILIGVGGSNQAARAVIHAMTDLAGPEVLYSGNSLSPNCMGKLLERIAGKSVYLNVIAKNFETLEPGICFRILREHLEAEYGAAAAERIIVTGTPESSLHRLAAENGYTFFTFPENIGGRFSVLSDVGLFPMAVAGVDIRALVAGAKDMQVVCGLPAAENLALRYACIRNLLYQKGYALEMLSFFEPRFRYISKWWIQLFAESEGKGQKGLYPVSSEYSEDLHSVGQFVQEGAPILFETFLLVDDPGEDVPIKESRLQDGFAYLDGKCFSELNRAAEIATIQAHSEKLPCLALTLPQIDAYNLGRLFYFFQFACYLSATILGVNPFDQPGVESYKAGMFEQLGK